MGDTSIVLWFRHVPDVKFLLSELMFVNVGVEIPTYVRDDNSNAVYQVDSVNTVTNEKRPNGFSESIRGG